jgi:glycosyltransferase involved in cell wall biosynthesis
MGRNAVKVCHFTSAHMADDVRIFHKECTSLAEAGFQVYLVAANAEEKTINGVTIVSANVPKAGRFSRMLKTSRAVYKKALSLNADIYHFHDPELLPYGLKLKRKGKKVIYDAHEDLPRQISGKPWIPRVFRGIIAWMVEVYENYVNRRLSFVVAATPTIRERFVKVNANCTDVCNYPLLHEIAEMPAWSQRSQEVCYIGGITVIRGVGEVVDALEGLPGVSLNLAGAYSPLSFKDELMRSPGWQQVNEFGFVDRKAIAAILNRSKVGVVTLYPQSNYLESLPIKMFEYMLAGIPVVASNFPLWQQIVAENNCGVCVDPKDVSAISAAINDLLANDDASRIMGENGRKAVLEKFNWSEQATKMIAIYDKLSQPV